MADEKISVIIPVYKTEKFLEKCIRSVLSQTYPNIEIILVDDGSPDRCASMCDDFACEDSRVLVIHKENGGLSCARNAGLEKATGDFIAFVDSDDYLDKDIYNNLIQNIGDADIAICGYYGVSEKRKTEHPVTNEIKMLSSHEALTELFKDEKIKNHVWNKLFRRELFEGIAFPEGRTFEDILTTYKLFEKSEKVCCVPFSGYYYVERDGAISKSGDCNTCFARYSAHLERYRDVKLKVPESRDVLLRQIFIQARAYMLSEPDDIEKILSVREFLRSNEKPILGSTAFSTFEKFQVSAIVEDFGTATIKLLDFFRKAEKLLKH